MSGCARDTDGMSEGAIYSEDERNTDAFLSDVTSDSMESNGGYARAAGRKTEKMITIDETKFGKVNIKRNEWEVFLTPPKEVTENRKRKTIIYRTVRKDSNKVVEVDTAVVEECLASIRSVIEHKKRGRLFGSIEVRFKTEKDAKEERLRKLETKDWIFLPTYMEKRMVKIRMNGIPYGVEPEWVVESALAGADGVVEVMTVAEAEEAEWSDKGYVLTVLASKDTLDSLAEVVVMDDCRVVLHVEGKQPRCYKCKTLGHRIAACPLWEEENRKKQKETEMDNDISEKTKESGVEEEKMEKMEAYKSMIKEKERVKDKKKNVNVEKEKSTEEWKMVEKKNIKRKNKDDGEKLKEKKVRVNCIFVHCEILTERMVDAWVESFIAGAKIESHDKINEWQEKEQACGVMTLDNAISFAKEFGLKPDESMVEIVWNENRKTFELDFG